MILKDDALEYLKQDRLQDLVARYSEFITFPIQLYKKTQEIVEEEEEEDEDDEEEAAASDDGLEVAEEEEKSEATKTEKVDVWGWHRINNNVAIWSREKEEVTDEEYQKFFKTISTKDPTDAGGYSLLIYI